MRPNTHVRLDRKFTISRTESQPVDGLTSSTMTVSRHPDINSTRPNFLVIVKYSESRCRRLLWPCFAPTYLPSQRSGSFAIVVTRLIHAKKISAVVSGSMTVSARSSYPFCSKTSKASRDDQLSSSRLLDGRCKQKSKSPSARVRRRRGSPHSSVYVVLALCVATSPIMIFCFSVFGNGE